MISNIIKYTLFNVSKDIFKNTNISTKRGISNIDLHHIFPKKAKCDITNEIYEEKYDEIDNYANLMPIDNDTNKKISHKRPSEYYNDFFSQNTNIDNCLKDSLIDVNYFKNNDFYNFLNNRKQEIVKKINEIFLGK